jgi:hypothetical protein
LSYFCKENPGPPPQNGGAIAFEQANNALWPDPGNQRHPDCGLSNPDDPLSLTAETTTVTMNGQIYTTIFSSATRTISGILSHRA